MNLNCYKPQNTGLHIFMDKRKDRAISPYSNDVLQYPN